MPINSAVSTQKSSNSLFTSNTFGRAARALKARTNTRFARIAGLSFAATFPVLGIVDPKVLLASGVADVQKVQSMVVHAESALRTMGVMELLATGAGAALALSAVACVGYLRTRFKAARLAELAAE